MSALFVMIRRHDAYMRDNTRVRQSPAIVYMMYTFLAFLICTPRLLLRRPIFITLRGIGAT